MEKEQINQLLDKQRQYFYSGATFDLDFRISALKRLRASIRKHEDQIHAALKKDLGKSNFESYMCETGLVLSEITHMLKNIRSIGTPSYFTRASTSSIFPAFRK